MAKIDSILKAAIENRASDIHLSSGLPPILRIDGELVPLKAPALEAEKLRALLFEILNPELQKKFLQNKNVDSRYGLQNLGNFRVNTFETCRGIAAVLRLIPDKIPTLQDLDLPPIIAKFADYTQGLVLVTGPTGSGKSTTLASLIHQINCSSRSHILTVEDPIEFVHTSKKALINQRQVGDQVHSFADALKYALREDPDVILVGEMRDLETISLALTAAETGHLVFGTLHTRGAGPSIDRIIDSFPANQQAMVRTMLSESLRAVVSQVLLRKAEGEGRIAAFEVMICNHAIQNLIREGKTFQIPNILQTAGKEGMILMEQYLIELVQKKKVNAHEAATYLSDTTPIANELALTKKNVEITGSHTTDEFSAEEKTHTTTFQTKEKTKHGIPVPPPIHNAPHKSLPPLIDALDMASQSIAIENIESEISQMEELFEKEKKSSPLSNKKEDHTPPLPPFQSRVKKVG